MTLRKFILYLLKTFAFNFSISNPWTDKRIFLHSFKHKGYWYHGKRREFETMILFENYIKSGMRVAEVGGHIGYITQYFSKLVGSKGQVTVFEPGSNNLPYLERNISDFNNINLVQCAISDTQGMLDFYEDDLTGQNNSLVKDFEGFSRNNNNALGTAKINTNRVQATTIDKQFIDKGIDFIKIDIEGAEWMALLGAKEVIKKYRPVLMVEIQANEFEIFNFFLNLNYKMHLPEGDFVYSFKSLRGNVFCIPSTIAELESNA